MTLHRKLKASKPQDQNHHRFPHPNRRVRTCFTEGGLAAVSPTFAKMLSLRSHPAPCRTSSKQSSACLQSFLCFYWLLARNHSQGLLKSPRFLCRSCCSTFSLAATKKTHHHCASERQGCGENGLQQEVGSLKAPDVVLPGGWVPCALGAQASESSSLIPQPSTLKIPPACA